MAEEMRSKRKFASPMEAGGAMGLPPEAMQAASANPAFQGSLPPGGGGPAGPGGDGYPQGLFANVTPPVGGNAPVAVGAWQQGMNAPAASNPNFGQQNGPGPTAAAMPAAAAGGGYVNPAMAPPNAAAVATDPWQGTPLAGGTAGPAGPMGAALARQMMERPTPMDKLAEYKDFLTKAGPMLQSSGVKFAPAAAGSLESFTPAGGTFIPPSPADLHDRSMAAFAGMDKMAGESEAQALRKYLGVGGLGVQSGQLDVSQRGQQASEVKLAHDIGMDRGAKAIDLMLAQGKEPAVIKPAMKLRAGYLPPGAGVPAGWVPGAAFPSQGGQGYQTPLGPVGGGAAGPAPAAGAAAAGDVKPPPRGTAAGEKDWTDVFPTQTMSDLNALKTKEGAKNDVASAAKILMRMPDYPGKMAHIAAYLGETYGERDRDVFAQPNVAQQLFQGLGNAFGRPSEEELASEKLRAHLGLKRRSNPLFSSPNFIGPFKRGVPGE